MDNNHFIVIVIIFVSQKDTIGINLDIKMLSVSMFECCQPRLGFPTSARWSRLTARKL